MPQTKHDWATLDPRIDTLKANGHTDSHIARELGVPRETLLHHVRVRQRAHPADTGAVSSVEFSAASNEPVQTAVQSVSTGAESRAEYSAEQSVDTHEAVQTAVQKVDTGQVQLPVQIPVQRFAQLEDEVQALAHAVRSIMERLNHTPVQSPVQITTLPPYPKGKAVRWNLWILDTLQDALKSWATEREISPSQLVQELLWAVVSARQRGGE
jgi:hypothetical protein